VEAISAPLNMRELFQAMTALRSRIRLRALDQAPKDTIKRVFVVGVNLIEIRFKRGLRGWTDGRIQQKSN